MDPVLLMLTLLTDTKKYNVLESANPVYYTIQPGDTLWKISVKYSVGLSELIAANPQIQNPALIYPNQRVLIPQRDPNALSMEEQVIELTNRERTQRGLPALTPNWQLSRVARYKAEDLHNNNYFSHYSPVYGSPFDMMNSFNIHFTTAGENIAMGQRTPESVVSSWMNSAGHRANILNRGFSEIGVGYFNSGGTPYWVQMFIHP